MKKFYPSQIVVIVVAVLVCISTLIPAAEILGQQMNLLMPGGDAGAGVFLMALSILAGVMALFKRKVLCLIFAILNLIIAFTQYASLSDYMDFVTAGFYLMMVSSFLLVFAAIFLMVQVPKKSKGIKRKKDIEKSAGGVPADFSMDIDCCHRSLNGLTHLQ